MKHITISSIIAICMGMSSVGWSYDTNMAKSYAELFAPVVGAKAGKALHLVMPDGFIKDIRVVPDPIKHSTLVLCSMGSINLDVIVAFKMFSIL